MSVVIFIKVLSLIICLIKNTATTGILEIKFIKYENPSHQIFEGTCCVVETSDCRYDCKNILDICISDTTQPKSCRYAKQTTTAFENDKINFDPVLIRGLQNPLIIEISEWKGQFTFNAEVNNVKYGGKQQLVASYVEKINVDATQHSTKVWKDSLFEVGGRRDKKRISIQTSVTCDVGYLLPDCVKKLCVPRDDMLGHYTCDDKGEKICLDGWKDVSTNCTQANVTSSFSEGSSIFDNIAVSHSASVPFSSENFNIATSQRTTDVKTSYTQPSYVFVQVRSSSSNSLESSNVQIQSSNVQVHSSNVNIQSSDRTSGIFTSKIDTTMSYLTTSLLREHSNIVSSQSIQTRDVTKMASLQSQASYVQSSNVLVMSSLPSPMETSVLTPLLSRSNLFTSSITEATDTSLSISSSTRPMQTSLFLLNTNSVTMYISPDVSKYSSYIHSSSITRKPPCAAKRQNINILYIILGGISILIIVVLLMYLVYQHRRNRSRLQKYQIRLAKSSHKDTEDPFAYKLRPVSLYGVEDDEEQKVEKVPLSQAKFF